MNFINNFNLNKKDSYYLIALLIFSVILVAYYITFILNLGVFCSDVYMHLVNALTFSGKNMGSSKYLYIAPLICFLTSLFFDIGYMDITAIYIVTGAFAILGNIGFYILLRIRFNRYLSLAGAVIHACFAVNLLWLANGTLDVPAMAMVIWTVLFTYIAINKNPKFYPLAFITFLLGCLIRYTNGFILPVVLLYFVYQTRLKLSDVEKKYIIRSILLLIVLIVLILIGAYIMNPANLNFATGIFEATQGTKGAIDDAAYSLDTWYYLKNFPTFISCTYTYFNHTIPKLQGPAVLGIITIIIMAIGGILAALGSSLKEYSYNKKLVGLAIILAIFITLTFTHINGLLSLILMLIILLLVYYIFKDKDIKYLDLNILFLAWFLIYFMYFTYFNIKVDRYIIPALPAFAYFLIAAINVIEEKVGIKKIIPIALMILFIASAFMFTTHIISGDNFHRYETMSDYLKNLDPDYESLAVANQRPFLWYMKEYVIPISTHNESVIDSSGVEYYISNKELKHIQNYTKIKQIEDYILYKHI